MIIDRSIKKFIVNADDSVAEALRRISDNRNRIVFVVDNDGVLEGVLSDGDFRRWAVERGSIDLDRPVREIVNRCFVSARIGDSPETIQRALSPKIAFIPLLDQRDRLAALACAGADVINLGALTIGAGAPVVTVAEIGNNHNGSLDLCRRLIDAAVDAGADCVKFQMRQLDRLYQNAGRADDAREDLGSQYTLDLLSRFNMPPEALIEAFDHCRARGVTPLCTPWDIESVDVLSKYGIEGYKIASADLTNPDLLRAVADTGMPVIQSTGMATEAEIREAVALWRGRGAPLVLLHCNSSYPAPFRGLNLRYMNRLQEIGGCPVGYSGHERGYHAVLAAVALGARLIEKHFTLDRSMEGNDHKVSLLPHEFKDMVQAIREVEEAMGSDQPRVLSQGEAMNREILAKSLVAKRPIVAGEVIAADMLDVKSPGKGLQPNMRERIIGRRTCRAIAAGEFLFASDFEGARPGGGPFRFRRPWGVPVRFHDCQTLFGRAGAPDLLEYHLSYKDMEAFPDDFFIGGPLNAGLIVHAPELFAGDHILDLCAADPEYRARSIRELNRVADMARALIPRHARAQRPLIVVNVGGFTMDASLPVEKRAALYGLVAEGLAAVDARDVELIPQTMPPFPWHFGGQRHHNLFMAPQEIRAFHERYGYRICLDVSHSKLACSVFGWSLTEFIDQVASCVAHLHLADASGVDGEGLQIGEGEIDFAALARQLDRLAPAVSFIPEVWQGHKNDGEGFWLALDRLMTWF